MTDDELIVRLKLLGFTTLESSTNCCMQRSGEDGALISTLFYPNYPTTCEWVMYWQAVGTERFYGTAEEVWAKLSSLLEEAKQTSTQQETDNG